ncbi:MAG: 50S ribosomal protein L11 methyltransferase [Chloroflexi bacterium]|nr:50S ribosomal protein L11 methyltransferase [Chloroflexota bacterium]
MAYKDAGAPVDWLELSVHASPEYVEPLSELFRRYTDGAAAVQLEGDWDPDNDPSDPGPPTRVTVTAYLKMDATFHNRRAMIDVGLRLISHLQPLGQVQERVVKQTEWESAWKAHFTTLRVGKRIVLRPIWLEYEPRPGDVVVDLDPGMAFGTGHHPTTRMCLEELERRLVPGMRVLDVGTGSGILAIAAAKLGAAEVVGVDIEEAAIKASRENAQRNGVGDRFAMHLGSLPHPEAQSGSFDLALANITARTIAMLAGEMCAAMKPGARIIATGIITEREDEAKQALEQALALEERRQDGDWVLYVARKTG